MKCRLNLQTEQSTRTVFKTTHICYADVNVNSAEAIVQTSKLNPVLSKSYHVSAFYYYENPSWTATVDEALVIDLNLDGADEIIYYGFETQPNTPENYDNVNIKIYGWENGVFKDLTDIWLPNNIDLVQGVGEISAGDFNGDNQIDLFLSANADMDFYVNAYQLINEGNYFERQIIGVDKWQHGSTAFDLNKDGYDDVIAASYDGAVLYLGGPDGLSKTNFAVIPNPGSDVVSGKFSDDKSIVVVTDSTNIDGRDNHSISLQFTQDGKPIASEYLQTLSNSELWSTDNGHTVRAVAIDYSKDGFDDLILFTQESNSRAENISEIAFYVNDGNGLFNFESERIFGYDNNSQISYFPVFSDFNFDGLIDIFVSSGNHEIPGNSTAFLIQNSNGVFVDEGREMFNNQISEGEVATVAWGLTITTTS